MYSYRGSCAILSNIARELYCIVGSELKGDGDKVRNMGSVLWTNELVQGLIILYLLYVS